ncbi:MAG: penicillin-binding protein 2 [Lachnospiraceae bacterium]|nr:penicillin-binding protein 2 [Lachnospiraceae bacterium]
MVLAIMAVLFAMLCIYFCRFIIKERNEVINNPYNTRINLLANKVSRGTIFGKNGEVLAETVKNAEGEEYRYYPYGSLFVHTVGYNSHGKSGIEYDMNYELLTTEDSFIKKLANDFVGRKDVGNNVYTTLDPNLQRAAYDALGDYNGAVVVIEVDTGKVLAMVSKPDFDPNNINELWESLIADEEEGALLNRTTQGLYTPGSVFKIITALAYMREHPEALETFSYTCEGAYKEGGVELTCYHSKVHGKVGFEAAFALSCNAAFAKMSESISYETYSKVCEELLLNTNISAPVVSAISSFVLAEDSPKYEYLYTMIGQGNTLITPMYAAVLAAAIANDGIAMTPYMVERVESADGEVLSQYKSEKLKTLMSVKEAFVLEGLMKACVDGGTGYKLANLEVDCAGKTGTAETSSDTTNAWFVGYTMGDIKENIAICVVVEESGTGSEYAVPVAKSVIEEYYKAE